MLGFFFLYMCIGFDKGERGKERERKRRVPEGEGEEQERSSQKQVQHTRLLICMYM